MLPAGAAAVTGGGSIAWRAVVSEAIFDVVLTRFHSTAHPCSWISGWSG